MSDIFEICTLLQRDDQLPDKVAFAVGVAIDWKLECKFVEGRARVTYLLKGIICNRLANFEKSNPILQGFFIHGTCYLILLHE